MATYSYACPEDGDRELDFPIGTAPQQATCPACGQWMNKQILAAPTHFKGRGWAGRP